MSFDRDGAGDVALGLEAAHARRRIVHAQGDGAGRIVINALARAVRAAPSIFVVEDVRAVELMLDEGPVAGQLCARRDGRDMVLPTRRVVLATGGLGGLYAHTTNPLGATGSGLALAARAGAVLRDLEFVQFHPTARRCAAKAPCSSMAAAIGSWPTSRGRNSPRGMSWRARSLRSSKRDSLCSSDARAALGRRFADRFPSVAALCRNAGLDPGRDLIPVRPAAHYHMGGVKVDRRGRASMEGLWACGEVASTGLHGANRLASNSLVEALAFARWIADDILGKIGPCSTAQAEVSMARNITGPTMSASDIRDLMTKHVGVIRDASGLHKAVRLLARQVAAAPGSGSDAALVALLVATAAVARRESRGAHVRNDYPTLERSATRR